MDFRKKVAYENLKALLSRGDTIGFSRDGSGHVEWTREVRAALKNLFGEKSDNVLDFDKIRYRPGALAGGNSNQVFVDRFYAGMRTAKAVIASSIKEAEDYRLMDQSEGSSQGAQSTVGVRKIFIVHGHDNGLKQEVARFIENQLKFETIILHEKPSGGKTVIEKVEANSDVGFAVVLLSPDDVGAVKSESEKLSSRARQNVIFEHGYFIGKLGRNRVLAIKKGEVENPSDIAGVIYVAYEVGDWKGELARELKVLGYEIDFNDVFG